MRRKHGEPPEKGRRLFRFYRSDRQCQTASDGFGDIA